MHQLVTVIIVATPGKKVWPTLQSVLGQSMRAVEAVIVGDFDERRSRRRLKAAGAEHRVTFAHDSEGRRQARGSHVLVVHAGQVLERHACMTLYGTALRLGAHVVSACGGRALLFSRDFLARTRLWPVNEAQSLQACDKADPVVVIPHPVLRAALAKARPPSRMEGAKSWVYHRVLLRLPVRRGSVVFESQEGRAYTGSPRAVYEELRAAGHRVRASWSFATRRADFPQDAAGVRRGSWAYHWALARAQVWVDDSGFPAHLRKRPSTTYVHTWPGVPVTLVGFEAPATRMASREDQRNLQRAIDRFDHIVVGSDFERDTLARALRPKAELLAVGHPRNDALITGAHLDRVERLRAELGLEGRRAVLYAPAGPPMSRFELRALAQGLGEGSRLLVRGVPGVAVDVSCVADVTSLLMLSEVLVTDWSPLLFDFALLDRAIIVHARELEAHTQRHGAYVDLIAQAPGPVTRTAAELLAALRDVRAGRDIHRAARRRFAERYGNRENGTAAKAVVARFLSYS